MSSSGCENFLEENLSVFPKSQLISSGRTLRLAELYRLVDLIQPRSWLIPNLLCLSTEDMFWCEKEVNVFDWIRAPGYQKMEAYVRGKSKH